MAPAPAKPPRHPEAAGRGREMKHKGRRCLHGGEMRREAAEEPEERTAWSRVCKQLERGFFEKWDVSQHKTKMKKRSSLGFLFVRGEEVETWVLYQ